jgi:hypothetical protein
VRQVVALWAVPRSASTAFERMVAERGDLAVVSEPFSIPYYDGPEARSTRFGCTAPDATFAAVRRQLLHGGQEPVFVKDMTYQVLPALDGELIDAVNHTVLVRDPAYSLPSFAKQWPDFTSDEAGFDAAVEVVRRLEAREATLAVIDTADLRQNPVGLLEAWCDHAGLTFDPAALRWEPGMAPGWERWEDWHRTTAATTGFLPPEDAPPPVSDPHLADAIAAATPSYAALWERRLRP